MKRIMIALFSLTVLLSLGVRAQARSQKPDKSSTATTAKAANIMGTVNSDGKTFVADKGNKTWTIENPESVKAHEGHHVSLNATENTANDTLHVNSVKMLGKSKTGTPSSTTNK